MVADCIRLPDLPVMAIENNPVSAVLVAANTSVLVLVVTLPLFLAEIAVWSCVVVLPLVYAALPNGLKRAARARLVPALRAGFR